MKRYPLFGGPANLVEIASTIAATGAQRLLCNPGDYRAAGLGKNGPVTFVAEAPRSMRLFLEAPLSTLAVVQKLAIEPDDRCPRGELLVP